MGVKQSVKRMEVEGGSGIKRCDLCDQATISFVVVFIERPANGISNWFNKVYDKGRLRF